MKRSFTKIEYNALHAADLVIGIVIGGLIIGEAHEEGGIPIIRGPYIPSNTYYVKEELEGFEFIMGIEATKKYASDLVKINNEKHNLMKICTISSLWDLLKYKKIEVEKTDIKLIDAFLDNSDLNKAFGYKSKFVALSETHFIMNKFSSLAYYDILYQMNQEFK